MYHSRSAPQASARAAAAAHVGSRVSSDARGTAESAAARGVGFSAFEKSFGYAMAPRRARHATPTRRPDGRTAAPVRTSEPPAPAAGGQRAGPTGTAQPPGGPHRARCLGHDGSGGGEDLATVEIFFVICLRLPMRARHTARDITAPLTGRL